MPPLVVFEMLLMINLNDIDHKHSKTLTWTTVFVPFWIFDGFWFLSESLCRCCCSDDGKGVIEFEEREKLQSATAQGSSPPTMGTQNAAVYLDDPDQLRHAEDGHKIEGHSKDATVAL